MPNRERLYMFVLGLAVANALFTFSILNGYIAKPSWIVPPDSMVVARDFISAIQPIGKK